MLPTANDKPLFTPGPLTTSRTVKQAMLADLGSRDHAFVGLVREVRDELLRLGGVSQAAGFECVLVQGSGTFGVEAVVSSVVPAGGRMLVLQNGAYGRRIAQMAAVHGIGTTVYETPEDTPPDPAEVERLLDIDPGLTHVAVVHGETTTGIVNPIGPICAAARDRGRVSIVDSMSAFGGIPLDLAALGADFLVSSANKCIEGVPGFSFVLARRSSLLAIEGRARTLSLDLLAQWRGLEGNGQFRFTPPTHALLAFRQALRELDDEGGVAGRHARYAQNNRVIREGMVALGFEPTLSEDVQGPFITSFKYPEGGWFDFGAFYDALNDRGYVIYPGKLSQADAFRIGNIGRLFPADMRALLAAVGEVVAALKGTLREH